MNKKAAKIAGIFLATAAVIAALFFGSVYFFVFKPSFERGKMSSDLEHFKKEEYVEKHTADKNWFLEQKYSEISIKSFDGLNLVACRLDAENPKGTFVLMHGYHSDPLREFAGLARFYYGKGYNVILPFQRSHGKSEGKYITFGVKERYDLRDWILETNRLYGSEKPVYLEGISMGCATVVMSLGFDLPENVKGVVADCGFTSPEEIIWKVLKKDKKLPLSHLIMAAGEFMTKHIAGFDEKEFSTLTALKHNKIPVIFIHGAEDDFVPIEMSITNFQMCRSKKSLYIVPDCPHAIAYLVDEEKYHKKVTDFLGI